MKNKRIMWIDSLKGFGIFCVTLGHLGCYPPLEKHIYSFHMFLFFFISGYLYRKSDSIKTFITKKLKNIFLPFAIWSILSSIGDIILGASIKETLLRMFIVNGELSWNAPIWFLLVLFITEILYAIINHFKSGIISEILTILIFGICWITIGELPLPLKLNLIPLAIVFYSLGNVIKKITETKKYTLTKIQIILSIIALGIISFVFGVLLNIRITYTGGNFGNISYCIIAALAGTGFYFMIFKNIKILGDFKLLAYMGRNSLIIMCTQYWFFRMFSIISYKFFQFDVWHWQNTLKAFLATVITISIICIGTELFKYLARKSSIIDKIGHLIGIH